MTVMMMRRLDSGANRSITPHRKLLHDIKRIAPMSIDGVGGTVSVDEVGYLKLTCHDDTYIWVKTYFCHEVDETIVSPTDITLSKQNQFVAWEKYCHVVDGKGRLTFYTSSGLGQATIPMVMRNGLWYTTQQVDQLHHTPNSVLPTIRKMSARAEYELWHQRLGHAGERAMTEIHKCVDGIPNLHSHKHNFHKCECCMRGKVKAAPKKKSTSITTTARGQMFHMDFGFVRGSDYKHTNEKGKIVTSRDGYNSYLIIVDAYTRYTWIFLSASKQPPLTIVRQFLQRYGIKEGTFRQVRCDQGGELAKSKQFRNVVQLEGYSVEPTGSDNSSQNGIAERPNRTFGNMMRAMLLNAGLPSKYWSYALIQAVFVKNRLPHAYHNYSKTPFEAITGRKPNVKDLKVFGSRVIAKNSNNRRAKLDDNTSTGIFLHHTGSTSISKYLDINTNREKTTSHLEYDEAHYTSIERPIGAMALIHNGYGTKDKNSTSITPTENINDQTHDSTKLYVQKLSSHAHLPTKATDGAAGLDLYSAEQCTIMPGQIKLIKTDIAISCPAGTYGRIAPRSGLTIKQKLDVRAGVIDSDYTGNVQVALHNIGEQEQVLPTGTKIAQLILEKIEAVQIEETAQLNATARGKNGFGSTDEAIPSEPVPSTPPTFVPDPTNTPTVQTTPSITPPMNTATAHPIPFEDNEIDTPKIKSFSTTGENIYLSCDPFGPTTTVTVKLSGVHPTLGFQLDTTKATDRLTLLNCTKGTPSAKLKRWRSTIRNGHLISINDESVTTMHHVEQIIATARQQMKPDLQFTFATEERVAIHTDSGTPQLYFDQLNAIAAYLQEIKYDEQFLDIDLETPILHLLKRQKKSKGMAQFSRKQLRQREDWNDWIESEHKQLNLYKMQNMLELQYHHQKTQI